MWHILSHNNIVLPTGGVNECFLREDEQDYRGKVNITKSGETCLNWQDVYNLNGLIEADVRDDGFEKNYCRSIKDKAFCFYQSGNRILFDECNIGIVGENCGKYL